MMLAPCPIPSPRRLVAALTLLAAVCLSACHAGPRNFKNENDRLRSENLDLTEQVKDLTRRRDALDTALHLAESKLADQNNLPALPPGVHRPVCTTVMLDRLSGGVDTDGDGHDDLLRLYLQTLDPQGRFILVVGRVEITVAALPAGSEARTLATRTFDAKTFDAAYRTGLAGTHYTLQIPITNPSSVSTRQLAVSIDLTDLIENHHLQIQQQVRWSP